MHIFHANLVTTSANAATISVCVLGIGFMLRFLLALTRSERQALLDSDWNIESTTLRQTRRLDKHNAVSRHSLPQRK